MDAKTAYDGFQNLGQCVAAAHVSKNLGISYDCMKSDMTGVAPPKGSSCPTGPGTKSMSLGKAIQTLSPTSDSKAEAKKGTHQADQDLKEQRSRKLSERLADGLPSDRRFSSSNRCRCSVQDCWAAGAHVINKKGTAYAVPGRVLLLSPPSGGSRRGKRRELHSRGCRRSACPWRCPLRRRG